MPLGSGVTPMVPVLESHEVIVPLKYGVALSGLPMIEIIRPTGVNEGLLDGGLPFRYWFMIWKNPSEHVTGKIGVPSLVKFWMTPFQSCSRIPELTWKRQRSISAYFRSVSLESCVITRSPRSEEHTSELQSPMYL